ncbi:MAG TPA: response regulator transcription factor [Rectinemataceae bacterium]|nr:response regulator transcription factor [Rectinemataceae bacterium]
MAKAVILVIEDDPEIREFLLVSFEREGWTILEAEDGERGLAMLATHKPDCIVLDIMLPGLDGLEVLRKIKADPERARIPVIMTTARGEDSDVISGLELGADDYVIKPFSPKILAARIRVALRRAADIRDAAVRGDSKLERGPLVIDTERHELLCEGSRVDLSATEFAILALLMGSPGRVFSRGGIIDSVKGHDYPVTDRSVDVQVLQLRKKLGAASEWIETVRGVGYRFRD